MFSITSMFVLMCWSCIIGLTHEKKLKNIYIYIRTTPIIYGDRKWIGSPTFSHYTHNWQPKIDLVTIADDKKKLFI